MPKLKDLVERFPKSSYADYARFALARGYYGGIGVRPPSDRVSRAMAADQLEKVIEYRWDPKLEEVVPSRFAYLPNALLLWRTVEPLGREHTLRRLDRVFPDAVEWLEEVAASLRSSNPEDRKLAEFVLGKKLTATVTDPFGEVKDSTATADGWKSYRKRAPQAEEVRRAP